MCACSCIPSNCYTLSSFSCSDSVHASALIILPTRESVIAKYQDSLTGSFLSTAFLANSTAFLTDLKVPLDSVSLALHDNNNNNNNKFKLVSYYIPWYPNNL